MYVIKVEHKQLQQQRQLVPLCTSQCGRCTCCFLTFIARDEALSSLHIISGMGEGNRCGLSHLATGEGNHIGRSHSCFNEAPLLSAASG